jgi:hypothetical protein
MEIFQLQGGTVQRVEESPAAVTVARLRTTNTHSGLPCFPDGVDIFNGVESLEEALVFVANPICAHIRFSGEDIDDLLPGIHEADQRLYERSWLATYAISQLLSTRES